MVSTSFEVKLLDSTSIEEVDCERSPLPLEVIPVKSAFLEFILVESSSFEFEPVGSKSFKVDRKESSPSEVILFEMVFSEVA